MDSVIFDGVEYVKASVLAKQFRYTADYIGQLCRGKKVDARLVGRTWFVNPLSIKDHKKNKYSTVSNVKVTESETSKEIKPVRIEVFPTVRAKTLKQAPVFQINNSLPKARKLKISYEIDDEFLIPELTKKYYQPAKSVRVEQAGAINIKIDGKHDASSFSPTPIPEVALSGKLIVTSFPDSEEGADVVDEQSKVVEEVKGAPLPKTSLLTKKLKLFRRKTSMVNIVPRVVVAKPAITAPPITAEIVSPVKVDSVKVDALKEVDGVSVAVKVPVVVEDIAKKDIVQIKNLNPVLGNEKQPAAQQPVGLLPSVQKMSIWVQISPLIATILAFILILVILSANTTLVSDGIVYNSIISFRFENLFKFIGL